MRVRRSLLYTPSDDLRKIRNAAALGADCVCLDLEDGVALSHKKEARQSLAKALQSLDFGRSERLARINPAGSGLEVDDLAAVLPAHPDGVVIPKVDSGDPIRWASQAIGEIERRSGWPMGGIRLLVGVETARGIFNLSEIVQADPRLEALIFGAEDLAANLGATRTHAGWEVFYARSAVVLCSAAFGLQAIDMVYVDFKDREGLFQEATQGAQMGFAGKQIIHPDQIDPVHQAFTPDDAAIARARTLMDEFARWQQAGVGAFALDGKMVDAPVIKSAERVIALARAAGKL